MYTLPSLISRRERRPSEVRVGMRITIREKRLRLGWMAEPRGPQREETEKINKTEVSQRVILSSKRNSSAAYVFSSVEKWQAHMHSSYLSTAVRH